MTTFTESRIGSRHYNGAFFQSIGEPALHSSRVIVPLVRELVPCQSVVDVGCGTGTWLSSFIEHGSTTVVGYDGHYVNQDDLVIPRDSFRAADLSQAFQLDGLYDLAVCLEVAEHLPAQISRHLVAALCRAAPAVLFSAAIPGQGGVYHINEQWPEYWQRLFADSGFVQLDPIRRAIFSNPNVASWYKQNTFLYARKSVVESDSRLTAEMEWAAANEMQIVSKARLASLMSFSGVLREVLPTFGRALRRRLRG